MEQLKYLEWDTNHFGLKIYKADFTNSEFNIDFNNIYKSSADLIYILLNKPSEKDYKILEKIGGKLYDIKLTYRKTIDLEEKEKETNYVIVKQHNLTEELENLVYESGIYSRFNLDPKLKGRFKPLYYEWILKSLNREIADEVFVIKYNESKIGGFVTLKKKGEIGSIELLAVSKEFRGKGLGTSLLRYAENYFLKKGIKIIEVVTQGHNKPACNLYEKNLYKIKNKIYIFHCYLAHDTIQ